MTRKKGMVATGLALAGACFVPQARAQTVEELTERVKKLEEEIKGVNKKFPAWLENLNFMGDLRFRFETIDTENTDTRERGRIRARFGVSARVTEHADLVFRLATGENGDPVSTNVTLDNSFSMKDIRVDLGYLDLHPTPVKEFLCGEFHLLAGKIKNPFFAPGQSELIWDHDLTPEGGALTYALPIDQVTFFTNLGGFWVDERSADTDSGLFGGQAGLKVDVDKDRKAYLTAGGSIYEYVHTAGYEVFDYRGQGNGFGNSTVGAGAAATYEFDYAEAEAFVEAGIEIEKIPVAIFGDLVINTATGTSEKTGWLAGFTVGKTKDPYSWALRYNYRVLEEDAVIGAFTDSDFIGGGTDGQGHEIGFDFMLWKNFVMGLTYFLNERNLQKEEPNTKEDYHRIQLDFALKF